MKKNANRKQIVRRWWLAVHLYLGLLLGGILTVTGVTGSLLVFYIELDELINPELVVSEATCPHLTFEELFQVLHSAEPERQHGWRLEIPDSPMRMITARYYKPHETEHMGFAPLMLSVNPCTGVVAKNRFWGQYAMTWIYDLHYTLLFGQLGKIVMAIIGGFLLASLLTGVYLWWPPRHKWRESLSFKSGASRERLTYDLHKLSGVYSLIVMLMLAITGIALEIPQYVNPVIAYFSPVRNAPHPLSRLPEAEAERISLDEAVAIARRQFPEAQLAWVETPHDVNGSYRINLHQDWEPSRRFPKTNIWIDQYSGQILQINNSVDFSSGESLITWLHPLHSGEAFAMPGRLLVFMSGLLCPVMFITGMLRWLQKRRAKQLKLARAQIN